MPQRLRSHAMPSWLHPVARMGEANGENASAGSMYRLRPVDDLGAEEWHD